MKQIFYTLPLIVLAFVSGIALATPQHDARLSGAQDQLLGAERKLKKEKVSKKKLLSENIYLQNRLGDELTIDVSVGTSEEWQEAGIAKLEELGVTTEELVKAGSIDKALRAEANKRKELCKI